MILRQGFFRDVPGERELTDYGARTDGQPVYLGHNKINATTSDSGWVLFFFKYDTNGNITEKYSLEGAWDDRVTLFVDYAL